MSRHHNSINFCFLGVCFKLKSSLRVTIMECTNVEINIACGCDKFQLNSPASPALLMNVLVIVQEDRHELRAFVQICECEARTC